MVISAFRGREKLWISFEVDLLRQDWPRALRIYRSPLGRRSRRKKGIVKLQASHLALANLGWQYPQDLYMNHDISYRYLIDPDEVREALRAFENQPIIGLDTETFWDYTGGKNRLSLLQLAVPTGEVVVIDALTAGIEKARPLIENPQSLMAAHNARFDDGVLRGAGFAVAGLIDTLRLARKALNLHSFSLASVSAHLFGVALDKTQQRSDWRQRPLSRVQLDYAALDAQLALRVYQELEARLGREGRFESEFRRAYLGPPEEKSAPPK